MPSSNLSQILKSDMMKTCVKEAKTWQDLEDVEKHSSFTGLAFSILFNRQHQFLPNRKLFFSSSTYRWRGTVAWKMFLCEYSCYPKPVVHL